MYFNEDICIQQYSHDNHRALTYHDSNKRLLELLVEHLSTDINARQPASVARMTVIPTNCILQSTDLYETNNNL